MTTHATPKMIPMVGIQANGTTGALIETRKAYGWYYPGCGGVPIDIVVPDDDNAQRIYDDLIARGLSVLMFLAPPEPALPSFPENDLFWDGDTYV